MIDIENISILVVDDMKSMRLTIRKMLKNLNIGTTLKFAENGKDGLEILRNMEFDLVISDWNMPVMNGVTMLGHIREDKKLRDMPVIMITAEAERDIVSQVAETEVNGYLLKPLTLGALETRIKSVVTSANNPEPVTVHRRKAREFEESGDYLSAIKEIRTALSHKPSASRLLRQLGLLHFKIKKYEIGEKCLLKAASVNKQDTITRASLAEYYLKNNELEKAGRFYLQILAMSEQYNDPALEVAETLLKEGIARLALEIFSRVIARSKKQNAVREKVIDICLEQKEMEFPLQLLEDTIKSNPSNYDMIYKAGLVHGEAGDQEKALNCFRKVDRHVRGHIDAKFEIAKVYLKKQKVLKADDYLNQILRIDPNHQEAIALRREI